MASRSSRRAFLGSLAAASVLNAKNALPLAVPGKPPYTILLSPDASPSERWAAEDLREHLSRMTGVILRIETGAGASPRVIAIGQSALTDHIGAVIPEGEACLLQTTGETVIIAGGRQRGTLYGVSLFLEKLGCRWFTPDIARIPRVPALWLPALHEVHRPAFGYREVFFTEAQGKEWSVRNRLNGHFHELDESVGGKVTYLPFAHAYYDLVPPDRHFDSHPEYFALVYGRRRREGAQLCLTNPAVVRLATEQAGRWLEEHPEVSIISLSQNDGGGWCECDPCRQVIAEEGGALSGLALRFANQVALAHPGKTFDMLAYQDTADPPSKTRPLANLQIRLCPIDACQAHSYQTCVYNRKFRGQLEQWSRIAPRLHIWDYSINFAHFLAPFPNYDQLIADIPRFHRAGISGMFIEGAVSDGGGADDAELRSWLAARLLWNPQLNAAAEIQAFLNAVYGAAAPPMSDYFKLRQQQVRQGRHLWIDQGMDAPYLTPAFLREARQLLQNAASRVDTDAARRRVDLHLLSLDYVEHPVPKVIEEAKKLGITNLREGFPIDREPAPEAESGQFYWQNFATLSVSLLEGYLTPPRPITWQVEASNHDTATLTGTSDSGRTLTLHLSFTEANLRVAATVTNPADTPARLVLICRARFACAPARAATILYRDQSRRIDFHESAVDGKIAFPGEGPWSLTSAKPGPRVNGRFDREQVGRCGFNWSFRSPAGLIVTMTAVSREVDVAPGAHLTLTTGYDCNNDMTSNAR